MSTFWRITLEAAVWTFLEMFFITVAPSVALTKVGDWPALYGLLASGLASALGAVASLLKSVAIRRLGAPDSPFISGDPL